LRNRRLRDFSLGRQDLRENREHDKNEPPHEASIAERRRGHIGPLVFARGTVQFFASRERRIPPEGDA
jgi:hypothetical protein